MSEAVKTAKAWLERRRLDAEGCSVCGAAANEHHEPTDPCGIVAGLVAEREWQPIATAPQGYDGQRFHYVLFKGTSRARSFFGEVVISGYMDNKNEPVYYYQYKLNITHWMELP